MARGWGKSVGWLVLMLGLGALWGQAHADTLADIQTRGFVRCGFRPSSGFVQSDANGRQSGFMVDFCRALAAATIGDANAIRTERLPDKPQEFQAVENHDVDVVLQNTTWTFGREASFDIDFVQPLFYDGQAFAVWIKQRPVPPLAQLGPETVCVKSSTTSQRNLEDYIRAAKRPWSIRLFRTWDEALHAFLAHECDMLTTDHSVLQASLAKYRLAGATIHVFPDIISREPLTPYVARGDRHWMNIVRWVIFATIRAEEKGITSANIRALNAPDGESLRLSGQSPGLGAALGLRDDWAFNVIAQVGNYGEIFDRNLGKASPYGMERGLNGLRANGGLMTAPLFQ